VNTLDSRSLHLHNCFAQPFPAAGEIKYVLVVGSLSPSSPPTDTSNGFKIDVIPKVNAGPPTQYTVLVSVVNGTLVPTPAALVISVGDIVLWHHDDSSTPRRFGVIGAGNNFAFSSGSLTNEAVFTHAFGLPGTYDWIDATGKQLGGKIVVSATQLNKDAERANYLKTLATPAACEIKDNKVTSGGSLNIVVGQTVFWKVWNGNGVTITDKRLVS